MPADYRKNTWKDFQSDFLARQRRHRFRTIVINFLITLIVILTGITGFTALMPSSFTRNTDQIAGSQTDHFQAVLVPDKLLSASESGSSALISKMDLKKILSVTPVLNADTNVFFLDDDDRSFTITTSLNIDLQEFLLSQLERLKKLTRGKPRNISFVVMEPVSGKILGLAGFDLDNPDINPCYQSTYPAASIFKIITAAVAVETLGFTPETPLYFNGSKYTLYKKQMKETRNKYTAQTSFAQAFAESINPVFGKISQNQIKKETLSKYVTVFGFNATIDSELNFDSGYITITEEPYQWAELGSGFNRETTISPIFGAMLTSSIVNSGKIPVPNIVEHVTDKNGTIVYQWENNIYNSAIQPETAGIVMDLMERTISKGTAKKAFQGYLKNQTLSQLTIGGKTGSLYNKERTIKYDWFTGFGTEKKGNRKLAVSIVVGHGEYYGTKASEYGKMILEHYFKQDVKTAQL